MEEFIQNVLANYGYLLYPLVLLWTFVEGETVVLIAGALAADPSNGISVELLALSALAGSFMGDQLYYYIGRRYGTPLLNRWPTFEKRIEWAFKLVQKNRVMFILSFRFIYGIRNFAPFVIGIAGVPRLQYVVLNFIAATIWAHSFAWGGYFLGKALEEWLGEHKWMTMLGFVLIALLFGGWGYLRQKRRLREKAEAESADATADPQLLSAPDEPKP